MRTLPISNLLSYLLLATLFLALPCAAQDSWTLEGGHVILARPAACADASAKAAKLELEAWVAKQLEGAKTPRVFVVSPDAAATLVAGLERAGRTLAPGPKDLSGLSPKHQAVYEALLERRQRGKQSPDFQALRKLDDGLRARLRGEKGVAGPLRDVLFFSERREDQIFLATVLGGLPPGPVQVEVLRHPELAVAVSCARHLPEDAPESLGVIRAAFLGAEEKGQAVLLREFVRREGDPAFLREVAGDTAAAVALRSEAVTALGRRKDPQAFDLCATLAQDAGASAILRNRAIVAMAECGGAKALPVLRALGKDESVRIRATAVLGLGRVGGKAAIAELERMIANEQDERLRGRAERMLGELRKQQEKAPAEKTPQK